MDYRFYAGHILHYEGRGAERTHSALSARPVWNIDRIHSCIPELLNALDHICRIASFRRNDLDRGDKLSRAYLASEVRSLRGRSYLYLHLLLFDSNMRNMNALRRGCLNCI